MVGFNFFSVVARAVEESLFHRTPLYDALDKAFGISAIDPMEQLGLYGVVGGAVRSAPLPPAPPAPPALGVGGQLVRPVRERTRARFFG